MNVSKEQVIKDFQRYKRDASFTWLKSLSLAISQPGFLAVSLYRVQFTLYKAGRTRSAILMRSLNLFLTGADFAPGARIGPGLLTVHPSGIVIGAGCVIGANCTIMQNVTLGEKHLGEKSTSAYPVVGNSCELGAGAVILGDISIGDNCIIGANSVVLKSLPSNSKAVGIPARILV